jgi:hypothetical protein
MNITLLRIEYSRKVFIIMCKEIDKMNDTERTQIKQAFPEFFIAPPEPVADNHCRTCADWKEHQKLDGRGLCMNLEVYFRIAGGHVHSEETFGCIFHSPKESA